MAKKDVSILQVLTLVPWYWSVIASLTVYFLLAFLLPSLPLSNPVIIGFLKGFSQLATFFAVIFLLPAPFALFNSWRKREQYDRCKNIDSIKQLDWLRFEELVAEYYRRNGYLVIENFDKGPDGGIDIRLRKDGHLHLVQCKHWKSRKVGVSVIREMYGLMISEMAATVIIVTSGSFTRDAKEFTFGKSIKLIEGNQLEKMIQIGTPAVELNIPMTKDITEDCPRCGNTLVKRLARKGKNAGNEFYGCSSFPKCRFTQNNL